jgi:anaerobic magnesium-protoporphyrin IX monomethyl ester cyclase
VKVAVVYLGDLPDTHRHPRHTIAPLRAGYAASALRALGHQVTLFDTAAPSLPEPALRDALARLAPDAIVLDPRFENLARLRPLASALASSTGILLAAGPPAESARARLLEAPSPFAGVLGGEYESALGALLEALAAGRDGAGTPGFTRPGLLAPREGPAPEPVLELDALPVPPHDQFLRETGPAGYRLGYPFQIRQTPRPAFVMTTRGCPHACTFCSPVEMRSRFLRYRVRDAAQVADELAWTARLGANCVYFLDDNFLRDEGHVTRLCEAMLARNLGLPFMLDGRADDVRPELLPLLRRAGCSTVCLGVESGSQRVLDTLRKDLTVDHIRRAVTALHEAGIWVVLYLILGSPGETEEDRLATFRLARELRPEMIQCHRFARYPMARGERSQPETWAAPGDKFSGSDLTPLAFDQRDLYRRFYLSPRFALDYLRTRSPYFPGPLLSDGKLALQTLSFLFTRP